MGFGAFMGVFVAKGANVGGRIHRWAATLMLVPLALVVGCQRDGTDPTPEVGGTPPTMTTPSPTPELDPVEAAEQAAVAAYRSMWAAFSEASRQADPDHPDLPRYATGDALELLVSGLEANRREGLVSDGGEVVLHPVVVEVEPAQAPVRATVSDCADTSETRRVRPTGPPFTDSPGGWRQVTATVEVIDGEWKVADLAVQEVGSCAPEQ
jgi:hypothetical protein